MNVFSKRLLSLFVAVVMVLSMVPAVSAAETDSTEQTTTATYQAPSKTYEADEWVEVGTGEDLIVQMKNGSGVNADANAEKVMGVRLTDDITLSPSTTGMKQSGTQLYIGRYSDSDATLRRAMTVVLDLNGHTLKTTEDVTLSRLFGAYSGSTFTLTNGILEMNGTYSAYSPVVFFQGAAKVTLDGVKVTLNDPSARPTHGGMFYMASSSNTLTIINSDLIVDGGDTGSVVKGGIVNTGAACTITLKNSNFTGGRVTGGVVSSTTHDAMGGQFYILGTTKFTAEDCTFTGGECVPAETSYKDYGGQIYKVSGSGIFKLTNCTFTGGSAARGAQIYYAGTSTSNVFENCTFTGGNATSWAGSLYNGGRLTLNNCEFTGNHGSNGGAVFNTGSYTTTYNSCTFDGNTATTGGSMSKYGKGTVILNDVDMSGTASSNGGALAVSNGTVILNSGSIHDGVAKSTSNGGGNVYIARDGSDEFVYGTFIMNGGSINDGKAAYGANVRIYHGRMIMNGGFVDNGVASGNGHCIHIYSNSIAEEVYDDTSTVTATYHDNFYMFGGKIASVVGATDEKSEICGGKIGNDVSEVISDHITQSAEKDAYGFYTISHIDNDSTVVNTPATCTTAGQKTTTCETCTFTHNDVVYGGTFDIEIPAAHTEETVAGKAPTCNETGLTEGKVCTVCGETTVAQEEIAATGHTEEVVAGKAPTCTETGLTEGKVCTICGEIIVAQEEIPAAHTEEIVAGKAPTCNETGLTEGKVCTVCGEIIVAQEEIAATGHTEEVVAGKAPTCTETGLTEGKVCTVCGETTVAQEEIASNGHAWDEGVVDPQPTCNGEGVKTYTCATCGETKTEAVAATGHTEEVVAGKAPTCTETGLTEGKKCTVCGVTTVAQEEIAAAGHTEEAVAGKTPTCEDTGLTEGKKCTVCGEITVAQEEIAALGHKYVGVKTEATFEKDAYTTYTCSTCGDSYVETEEGTKLTAVAQVGEQKFETFEEAVAAATENQTVELLTDVTLTQRLTVKKTVTLDLNGFDITGNVVDDYGMIYVGVTGNLTIVSEPEIATFSAEGSEIVNEGGYAIGNYGTVNVDDVTVTGTDTAIYNFYYNGTTYGKTTIGENASVSSVWNCGELTVNGNANYIDNSGALTVNGTAAEIYAQDGSDAPDVPGAGTVAIANTSAVTVPEGYTLIKQADGSYKVSQMVAPNADVTVLEPVTLTPADNYMVWPSGDDTINRPLEIVMNFKAKDTLEECVNGGYSEWLTDFNITLTGLENDSIIADNCYLAGNYGTFGWIVIPTDGLELEEGVTYPVVAAYDASLNYKDICDSVKDFTAAIHIDQAILDANPNLEVKLELVMTNPEDAEDKLYVGEPAVYNAEDLTNKKLPEAEVAVLDKQTLADGEYRVWNGIVSDKESEALVAGVGELPLEVVMNFKAVDTLEECLAGGFSKWLVDFYIDVEGLENGSFTADNCYLAGNYGSYGWIKIPLDGQTVEAGVEYPVVSIYDPTLNYKDICKSVKDFTAALHIDQAILDANPDMTVTLTLKMTNPDNANEVLVIGEPATYDVKDLENGMVAKNVQTGKMYTTVDAAVAEMAENQTVILLANASAGWLTLWSNRNLDLNGYELTAEGIASTTESHVVDSTDGKGLLLVDKVNNALYADNDQLPLMTEEGCRFASVDLIQRAKQPTTDTAKYQFYFVNSNPETMLAQELLDGGEDNAVMLHVKLYWQVEGGSENSTTYIFKDSDLEKYAAKWQTGAFYLNISGVEKVATLKLEAHLISEATGTVVTIASEPVTVK